MQVSKVILAEKKLRLAHLQKVQLEIGMEKNRSLVGKTLPVLVEGLSRHSVDELAGRTPGNKTVNFPGDSLEIGEEVAVRLTDFRVSSLRGDRVGIAV